MNFKNAFATLLPLVWLACARDVRADAMLQLFNLSWNQVADKIPEIAEAGYSSMWLPPPTKGGSGYSVGYDLFDPLDLGDKDQRGTVATRYGTKEELLRMVRIAHRFGLRIYFDNIVNHRAFDVPGYDANTPTNLYPGMVPGDFHLMTIAGGFFRNANNIDDYATASARSNRTVAEGDHVSIRRGRQRAAASIDDDNTVGRVGHAGRIGV